MERKYNSIEVGLVLQGGGALGAYEWGAASALLDLMRELKNEGRNIRLTAVTGVSIGAFNAACIVGSSDWKNACDRLDSFWNDIALKVPQLWESFGRDLALFGLPHFYSPRPDVWSMPHWTYIYDTSELPKTLESHASFPELNDSKTAFIVTAVNVLSGELIRFCNATAKKVRVEARAKKGEPERYEGEVVGITADHVLASGSIPPMFPWTDIDPHGPFWDGGLVDNTPLGDAIDAFSTDDETCRLLVTMNLFPLDAKSPRSLPEVWGRMEQLRFGNRIRQDKKSADRISNLVDVIRELRKKVSGDLPLGLDEKVRRALNYRDVATIDIDFEQGVDGAANERIRDLYAFRDFFIDTVKESRQIGYRIASQRLRPEFDRVKKALEPA